MDIFCFTSKNVENIQRGIAARLWAVARVSDSQMRSRQTKARKYFHVGSCGLLYCSSTGAFTVPFEATSAADPDKVVLDVWPEPWVLPFSINPLGTLDRQLKGNLARQLWPFADSPGGITAGMCCNGTQTFTPKPITDEQWQSILEHLGSRE